MRILFVDQFGSPGGGQLCLLDSLRGVLERGWQATVALPDDGPVAPEIRGLGVEVAAIPSGPYRSGAKSPFDLARYVRDTATQKRTLMDLLGRERFDVIYANGPRILKACVAAAGGRIPVLFHVHNYLGQRYAVRIAGRSIRGGDVTLAACCNHVAKPLASFVPAGRLHIVPNGVPDVPYSPPPKPQVRIGLIGRISSEKGHLVFIEAAREVARELPQGVFVICGSPTASGDAYFDSVRQAAEGLPFEFIPWQPRIDAVLGSLSLLVAPSLQEGAPRVILEAFSAGVPVLASAVGGIPEIVEEGRNGFLSPPGSAPELARRISLLVTDTNRLRAVAANARSDWERLYDVSIYRRRITNLLESLVRERAPGNETEARPPHTGLPPRR